LITQNFLPDQDEDNSEAHSVLKTVFIEEKVEEEEETTQESAPPYPEIAQLNESDLKDNLLRATRLLTIENVDMGLFQLGKIFEYELKRLILQAEMTGQYQIAKKDKSRLFDMIDCAIREEIVGSKHELTYLRQERNESAHGNIPDQDKREYMIQRAQYLAGLYIHNILQFSKKQQELIDDSNNQ